MNFLVFLEAGELEKILSGIKSMIIKTYEYSKYNQQPVRPGDSLYFMRAQDEGNLQVKAVVCMVRTVETGQDEDLDRTLKELQPMLQLTEEQYNHWSVKKGMILIEFGRAQKISPIHIAEGNFPNRSNWIAFKDLYLITEQGGCP